MSCGAKSGTTRPRSAKKKKIKKKIDLLVDKVVDKVIVVCRSSSE